ncbi:MAG: NAD(P)/FAD-dependent oxidoreductase [Cyclobacteriaceae bacterium]
MSLQEVDCIIVGAGIAGTTLSHCLLQRGKRIALYDIHDETSSSRVAAGLYNPITGGRHMKKSWLAEELFPELQSFYSNIETQTHQRFLYPNIIYRPFASPAEHNDFYGYSVKPFVSEFVECFVNTEQTPSYVIDPNGGIEVKQGGHLDVNVYLDASHKFFAEKGVQIINEKVAADQVNHSSKKVQIGSLVADRIIFCTGHHLSTDALFSWLPWKPVKGEVLSIKSDVILNKIYNRGCFIIPQSNGLCRVGATYSFDQLDTEITEEAKNEIYNKFTSLLKMPFEVCGQKAGIRPATSDRKPFAGIHPKYPHIGIFGGLGSKGVSLAPFFASNFVEYLFGNDIINSEINIERYYSLY